VRKKALIEKVREKGRDRDHDEHIAQVTGLKNDLQGLLSDPLHRFDSGRARSTEAGYSRTCRKVLKLGHRFPPYPISLHTVPRMERSVSTPDCENSQPRATQFRITVTQNTI